MITVHDLLDIINQGNFIVDDTTILFTPGEGYHTLEVVIQGAETSTVLHLGTDGVLRYSENQNRFHEFPRGMTPAAIAQELVYKLDGDYGKELLSEED